MFKTKKLSESDNWETYSILVFDNHTPLTRSRANCTSKIPYLKET